MPADILYFLNFCIISSLTETLYKYLHTDFGKIKKKLVKIRPFDFDHLVNYIKGHQQVFIVKIDNCNCLVICKILSEN